MGGAEICFPPPPLHEAMPPTMLLGYALLVLVLLLLHVDALPDGTFCWTKAEDTDGISMPSLSPSSTSLFMTQHCVTWTSFPEFYMASDVFVRSKYFEGDLPTIYANGTALWAAPDKVVLALNGSTCDSGDPPCCDLCDQRYYVQTFAGLYEFFISPSYDDPQTLAFAPPPNQQPQNYYFPQNWGGLKEVMVMQCQDTCGDWTSVVPNPYEGGNVSYSVRRFQFLLETTNKSADDSDQQHCRPS